MEYALLCKCLSFVEDCRYRHIESQFIIAMVHNMTRFFLLGKIGLLFGAAALILPSFAAGEGTPYSANLAFRLSQKRTVYNSHEAIPIKVRVINEGDDPVTLRLVDVLQTSFFMSLRTESGQSVPVKVPWILSGQDWQAQLPVDKKDQFDRQSRHLLLQPGESYSRRINLQEIFEFRQGEDYVVHGYFFPNFLQKRELSLRSQNRLDLSIRPLKQVVARESSAQKAPGIAPDEVVFMHLKAEMERRSRRYLKYLDLDRFIKVYDSYYERFVEANKVEKQKVMNEFREYLTRNRADKLLNFRVIRTIQKKEGRAHVHVYIKRYAGRINEHFIYDYLLTKDESRAYWRIVDLKVTRKKNIELLYY